jgi:hypothetical protein
VESEAIAAWRAPTIAEEDAKRPNRGRDWGLIRTVVRFSEPWRLLDENLRPLVAGDQARITMLGTRLRFTSARRRVCASLRPGTLLRRGWFGVKSAVADLPVPKCGQIW